jgi:lactate dehydrogenase-like 2-hydroxyacid dehydrogenase
MLGLIKRVRELMAISEAPHGWGQPPRRCDEDHFAYNWSGRRNLGGLMDRKVGILGFGEIGVELARRLKGFDCTVLYQKRRRLPPEAEAELSLGYVASPAELAAACDIVVALLPLSPATDQRLNAEFFEAMKPGALFVHSGGSGTVDEAALAQALSTGHLGGAAADGFTWEPTEPNNPLIALAHDPLCNLILTPHVAAGAITATGALRAGDYANITALLAGRPLRYQVV